MLEWYLTLLVFRGASVLIPGAGSAVPLLEEASVSSRRPMRSQPRSAVDIQASKSLQTEGPQVGFHSNMSVVRFRASAGVWVGLA